MKTSSLSIAITADPELPVPPRHYGGIERVIHGLVARLTAAGHRVVVFAHRDSRVSCELVPYPGTSSTSSRATIQNASTIASHLLRHKVDLIHSFSRLQYLAPLALHPAKKLMTYQRPITQASVRRAVRLFGATIEFTACSESLAADVRSLARWHVVYNPVPVERYTFTPAVSDAAPLVFLGRIEHIKGPHIAIEVARRAGRRLVLAGNIPPEHHGYFEDRIRPHLDGSNVTYVGPVGDDQKNALLGRAAALLMPVLWDEPFGIVMAESLACGTPVIALGRGSVPEVVEDSVTGYIAADIDGLVAGVLRLNRLNRGACRRTAESRFSEEVIASKYEAIYRDLIGSGRKRLPVPASAMH